MGNWPFMLNGLLWIPSSRKKKRGPRQIRSRLVALSLFTTKPQNFLTPPRGFKPPRRLRLRLRTSLLYLSTKSPLASALLDSVLPPHIWGASQKSFKCVVPDPSSKGGLPRLATPTYLRVPKASKPARAVLRFFYFYISNPTPSVISFTKTPVLWTLSRCGALVKSPFN